MQIYGIQGAWVDFFPVQKTKWHCGWG